LTFSRIDSPHKRDRTVSPCSTVLKMWLPTSFLVETSSSKVQQPRPNDTLQQLFNTSLEIALLEHLKPIDGYPLLPRRLPPSPPTHLETSGTVISAYCLIMIDQPSEADAAYWLCCLRYVQLRYEPASRVWLSCHGFGGCSADASHKRKRREVQQQHLISPFHSPSCRIHAYQPFGTH
jgi:hypothetical protein